MRQATRLFAKCLEAGRPTGLAGLFTHAAPRPALLAIYGQTLERLKALPETSVYRQSVEAITKHRLGLVQSVVPEGHREWLQQYQSRQTPETERASTQIPEKSLSEILQGLQIRGSVPEILLVKKQGPQWSIEPLAPERSEAKFDIC